MSTVVAGRARAPEAKRPGHGGRAGAVHSPLGTALAYFVAVVIVVITIVPLLYMFIGGFRTTAQIAADPSGLPSPWVWSNYGSILSSSLFWHFVANSAEIACVVTVITVLLGAMASFALSRYAFKGRDAIYAFFTIGLLFPLTVAALPLYLQLRRLGMLGSMWGVAIPEAAFQLSITIVIMRPFMRAIPVELEDAAVVDGTTRFGFFWRVLLPLSAPALTTVGVLAFVTSWNFFILPLLVFNSTGDFTLPLGVSQFQSQYSADTAKVFAFTALSMLPTLFFFSIAQRRIVGGLTGAVKG